MLTNHFLFTFQLSQYVGDQQAQQLTSGLGRSYLTLTNNGIAQQQGQGHVIQNPYQINYSNYGDDLHDGLAATLHLRDSVYMSPQLAKLTSTLRNKKKSCQSPHPADANGCPAPVMDPASAEEVVFRAVSPHGHVYWEIDPSRQASRLSASSGLVSANGFENIPNPLMEQHEALYGSSRQSSSRYSDNHPLISSGLVDPATSPAPAGGTILVNPFADVQLLPASTANTAHNSPMHATNNYSPGQMRPELRFSSLRGFNQTYTNQSSGQKGGGQSASSKLFTNRSASARAAKMRDIAKQIEHMRILQQQCTESGSSGTTINTTASGTSGSNSPSSSKSSSNHVPEQIQQQVQIKDLKTQTVTTATSTSGGQILSKIHNAMSESLGMTSSSPKQRKV